MDMHSSEEEGHSSASVTTESGKISGLLLSNNVTAFLGVPYAATPVEELRWRPPQPHKSWSEVRPTTKFGPSSVQFPIPENSMYSGHERHFSEDCLYLNIWTQAASVNAPVLVWLHFGAFQIGSASNPMFNGAQLAAKHGITVVTVGYRLGRFGFLAHPELSAESGHSASGNYGIMDQIAALEWIQRNIGNFGGDAANVTIGGFSAGGTSVHILRCSPRARQTRLFSKIICESGACFSPVLLQRHGNFAHLASLSAAEEAGKELLESLGVSSIDELRKMPADEIASAQLPRAQGHWVSSGGLTSGSLSLFDTGYPIVDGNVLEQLPFQSFQSSRAVDVPALYGHVSHEGIGLPVLHTLAQYRDFIAENWTDPDEVLRLYPANTDEEAQRSSNTLLADLTFVWPTWNAARSQARNMTSPVWYYKFERLVPISPHADLLEKGDAAFHGANTLYGFNTLKTWQPGLEFPRSDLQLSDQISAVWAKFLWTGDPNTGLTVEKWPQLQSDTLLVRTWDVSSHDRRFENALQERMALLDRTIVG